MSGNTEQEWIKTTCAYCGVGCGVEAQVSKSPASTQIIVSVRGDESHPANFGRLCSKGLALGETVVPDGRALDPSINGQVVDWGQALDTVAQRFEQTVKDHGPDAVAFYVSGQLLTEDYYVANKLMKGFIGSANIDTNSRLCMASSVVGHKRAFGSDTVPNNYEDFELADLVVLVGSNLAWCHPVLYQRLKAAKQARPEMRVVNIDPRATDTNAIVDLHLPLAPGSDVLLFNGLLAYLADNGHINESYIKQYTQGFDEALASARSEYQSEAFYRELGLPRSLVDTFYQWVGATDKTVTAYSQGVNQSTAGVDKVNAIINCHLATGRIGKPGSGPFSVTGQPNAMGGREVGGLANTLASHLEFGNPESHALVSDYWQTATLAKEPGLKAVDMFDAIADGKVKAVWIMATNPAASLPNAEKVRAALAQCDFVVVSDCIADTDTGKFAHVVLPAQGWAEKSGTVTNSERRISRQRRIVEPLGQAKPDWWIICEVAKRMGFEAAFSYQHEADIFREYAQMTTLANLANERDLSLETLCHKSQQQYDDLQPVQWPTRDDSPETERLFSRGDFYTPDRKGRLIALQYRAPATKVSGDYPFVLNTGRIRDQWHTMTRTGLTARLGGHIPEPFIAINPTDASALGIEQDAIVQLSNDFGTALGRADITDNLAAGQLFMPIHWTGSHSAKGIVSALVSPEFDALSGQPESKFTPVALAPWEHSSQAWLLVREPIGQPKWDYWVMQRVEGGYLYSIAGHTPAQVLAAELKTYCSRKPAGTTLDFSDAKRGSHRYCHYNGDTLSSAFMVASRLTSDDKNWATELLTQPFQLDARHSMLAGRAVGDLARGKLICACKQVGSKLLQETAASQGITCVEALSEATSAGTGCGSCLPELEQFLAE